MSFPADAFVFWPVLPIRGHNLREMRTGEDSFPVSEFELIEQITVRPPDPPRIRVGIGDDASVVDAAGRIATSVDTAVDGIHFHRGWSTPEQIGMKAVGSALSDLAAMGAGERGVDIYLSLGSPRDLDPELLRGIARGTATIAARHGAALAGGDTVGSPVLFLAVTVTGHLGGDDPVVARSGARPGDLVVVTGELGGARAGLWLLENPALPVSPELPAEVRASLIGRQLEAEPRIAVGAALARAGATAMIDLSDGLVADLGHVARASSVDRPAVTIRLEAGQVPVAPGAAEVAEATGTDRLTPALAGGEDYELAATLPPGTLETARAAAAISGVPLTVVGEVEAAGPDGEDPVRVHADGKRLERVPGGFDHFA